jgi:aminoglycoside phosphotransferase (APT) family kinase protein
VTPWERDELDHVLTSLARVSQDLTPTPVPGLPPVADRLAEDFLGWSNLRSDLDPGLDAWAAAHLDDLVALAEQGHAALVGESLVHLDVRADNLLVRADGSVAIVDWPHATTGPSWLDTLLLLVNVELYGGHDTDALARRWIAFADPDDLTGVLAGFAGFFLDYAGRPKLPALPTLREFQRRQGVSTARWIRRRLES